MNDNQILKRPLCETCGQHEGICLALGKIICGACIIKVNEASKRWILENVLR